MTKLTSDPVLDAGLEHLRDLTSPVMHVCSGDPADRAAVIANSLADHPLLVGDYTIQDRGGGGREAVIAAQNGVDVDVSGTAAHVCIIDATLLHLKTSCNAASLDDAGTVDIGSFTVGFADPT